MNSQAITDPLLDSGPDSSTDYLALAGAYGGYMPLAAIPPLMGGYYGYSAYGYNPYGYSPYGYSAYGYPVYGYSFMQPYVGIVRPSYSRVLSFYQIRSGGVGVFGSRPISPGLISSPRPVLGPRPAAGVHVGAGHAVGRR